MGVGVVIVLIPYGVSKCFSYFKSKKIYTWLKNNTDDNTFKSTADIANALHIPEEKVRKICARHKKIYEGQKDLWNIDRNKQT